MVRTTGEMVAESFAEKPDVGTREYEQTETYLAALRDNWKNVAQSLGRAGIFVLVLSAIFVLIVESAASKLSFAGLELGSTDLVAKLLPALIAFGFYEMVSLSVSERNLQDLHTRIVKRHSPEIERNDFEVFLRPPVTSFLASVDYTRSSQDRRARKIADLGHAVLYLMALALPVVIQVYAFSTLFNRFGSSITLWICLTVSVVFTVLALAGFIAALADSR